MEYPARPYAQMEAGELTSEYERICRALSRAQSELAEIKVQYAWLFLRGYRDSVATSVAGRDRDGEMAALAVREDELRSEGEIAALSVIRDMLSLMVKSGHEVNLV